MVPSDRLRWIAVVIANKRMPGAAVRVAGVLANAANGQTGQCNPSALTVANQTALTERAVRGALSKLIGADYLEVTGSRGGRGRTSNYYLKFPMDNENGFRMVADDNGEREFSEREFM